MAMSPAARAVAVKRGLLKPQAGGGSGGAPTDPTISALAKAYLTDPQIKQQVNAQVHAAITPQLHQLAQSITDRTSQGNQVARDDVGVYGAVASKYAGLGAPGTPVGSFGSELAGAMSARGAEEAGFAKASAAHDVGVLQGQRSDLLNKASDLRTQATSQLRQQNFSNAITTRTLLGTQAYQQGQIQLGAQRNQLGAQRNQLSAQQIQAQINHNSALDTLAGRRIDATLRGQDIHHQDYLANLLTKGGPKALTPAQAHKLAEENSKIVGAIKEGAQNFLPYLRQQKIEVKQPDGKIKTIDLSDPANKDYVRQYIYSKVAGKDADVTDAIFSLDAHHTLSNDVIARLKKRGITLPNAWLYGISNPGTPHRANRT